jgi:uncharacterized membrane protein (UPF0127 family)
MLSYPGSRRRKGALAEVGLPDTKTVAVVLQPSGEVLLTAARWCESAACRFLGLQFRRGLGPQEGLLLAHPRESTLGSSIHMFFVFFPIAAIWINTQGVVTSAQLARPWRPYYASPAPARYVLEARPELLTRVRVGDRLEFRPSGT